MPPRDSQNGSVSTSCVSHTHTLRITKTSKKMNPRVGNTLWLSSFLSQTHPTPHNTMPSSVQSVPEFCIISRIRASLTFLMCAKGQGDGFVTVAPSFSFKSNRRPQLLTAKEIKIQRQGKGMENKQEGHCQGTCTTVMIWLYPQGKQAGRELVSIEQRQCCNQEKAFLDLQHVFCPKSPDVDFNAGESLEELMCCQQYSVVIKRPGRY